MNQTLVGRLRSLEKAAGIQSRSMAFVEICIGETLDEALARQGVDRVAHRGLFILHGREQAEGKASQG